MLTNQARLDNHKLSSQAESEGNKQSRLKKIQNDEIIPVSIILHQIVSLEFLAYPYNSRLLGTNLAHVSVNYVSNKYSNLSDIKQKPTLPFLCSLLHVVFSTLMYFQ
jgi:hypothetical protein